MSIFGDGTHAQRIWDFGISDVKDDLTNTQIMAALAQIMLWVVEERVGREETPTPTEVREEERS